MARVSIGVPIFNGAATLSECLDCLRGQTFEDFEVLMLDNGSSDATPEICAEFARQDHRFRYFRSTETLPMWENFEKVLGLSQADYFIWRADDDLASSNHLAVLVEALDGQADARLAVTPVQRTYSETGRQADYPLPKSAGSDRLSRVKANLLGCHPSWFYGLWRRAALLQDLEATGTYPYLWAHDHLATMPAIINDQLVTVPGATFIQRIMREGSYHLEPVDRLAARKAYVAHVRQMIATAGYSQTEQAALRKTLEQHADKRVAPWFRTCKRAIRQRIKAALGLGPRPGAAR